MISEGHLLSEISRHVGEAVNFAEALELIQLLLEEEVGRVILLVRLGKTAAPHLRESTVVDFLESREFPFRAIYTSSFSAGDGREAVLIGCFGSWGSQGYLLERAITHAAEQLGAFLARTEHELNEAA